MREAMLFGTHKIDGKKSLHGLVARVAVPIGIIPDVVIFQGKLYVFHYEGTGEIYYRLADTYHYQKSAVMVDGEEITKEEGNAHLLDHCGGRKP